VKVYKQLYYVSWTEIFMKYSALISSVAESLPASASKLLDSPIKTPNLLKSSFFVWLAGYLLHHTYYATT